MNEIDVTSTDKVEENEGSECCSRDSISQILMEKGCPKLIPV